MNTAESLKKTGESTYSKIRRAMIANPLLTGKTPINKFAKIVLKESDGFDTIALKYHLLDQYQPHVNEDSVELCSHPKRVNIQPNGMKNCPECSKAGFHCDYYQLLWFERCPIHGMALVEKCPECSQPWPTLSKLAQNDCPCCGTNYTIEELSENNAFDLEPYDKVFKKFGEIFDEHLRSRVVGYSDKGSENDITQFDLLNDYEFPERHCVFHPELYPFLSKATTIDRADYKLKTFTYTPLVTELEKETYRLSSLIWANTVFEEVDTELRALLKTTESKWHSHTKLTRYMELNCPYCLAYSVWYNISKHKLSSTPNDSVNPMFGQELWRVNDWLSCNPKGASPVMYLTRTLSGCQQDLPDSTSDAYVGFPEDIAKQIYRITLCKSFENIALYLLYRAKLTNYSDTGYLFSSALIKRMPYAATPSMTYLFEVFMLERAKSPYTIEIAIPENYSFPDAAFDQSAIDLYREYQEHAHLGNEAVPEIYGDGPSTVEEYERWSDSFHGNCQRRLVRFERSEAKKKTGWQLVEPV